MTERVVSRREWGVLRKDASTNEGLSLGGGVFGSKRAARSRKPSESDSRAYSRLCVRVSACLCTRVCVLCFPALDKKSQPLTFWRDLSPPPPPPPPVDDSLSRYVSSLLLSSSHPFSGSEATTARWAGSITGCPNHVNWAINPNDALVRGFSLSLPLLAVYSTIGSNRPHATPAA